MRTSTKLQNEWWQQIRSNAKNKRMLSDEEINEINLKITAKRNMLFFREDTNGHLFNEIAKKIDREIYPALPNRLYSSMRDDSYGLTDREAKELKKNLNKFVSENISIPYLSLLVEKAIIKRILDSMIDCMRKGVKI